VSAAGTPGRAGARGEHRARGGQGVRIGALVFAAVALTLARWSSPEPLNGLHLALLPAALYILVVQGLRHRTANKSV
jgi:hypothetical protein